MRTEYNNWPKLVRFFAPQIQKHNLKTFIIPIVLILFIGFYYLKLWWNGLEFNFFERLGFIFGIALLVITAFQIGSYFWIKNNSTLDLIPSDINKENKMMMILFFVVLPLMVLLFSFIGYFK